VGIKTNDIEKDGQKELVLVGEEEVEKKDWEKRRIWRRMEKGERERNIKWKTNKMKRQSWLVLQCIHQKQNHFPTTDLSLISVTTAHLPSRRCTYRGHGSCMLTTQYANSHVEYALNTPVFSLWCTVLLSSCSQMRVTPQAAIYCSLYTV
jgi:hypothetical protein